MPRHHDPGPRYSADARRKRFSRAKIEVDRERATVGQHVAFWIEQVREGSVLMFGPVIDPHESWDFGVLRVTSEAAALALIEKDPAKTIGVHELFPIPVLIR